MHNGVTHSSWRPVIVTKYLKEEKEEKFKGKKSLFWIMVSEISARGYGGIAQWC